MKFKNTFFRTLRSAIFLIAMFLFALPQVAVASNPGDLDIGLNWNCDDLKIRWEKKMAAFYIDLTVYDESGDDDWLEQLDIRCNGTSFMRVDGWWGGSENARSFKIYNRKRFF